MFIYKLVIKWENISAVLSASIAVGIASMLVDEVEGYKRYRGSTISDNEIASYEDQDENTGDEL